MNKKSYMKKNIFFFLLLCMGCHIPSKVVMEGSGGRNAYNIEVQKTNGEEMLLNLVRLRYFDSPFFLEVSSVTSTFTLKNSVTANVNIPGFNNTNPSSIGGETLWQSQPTIQYTPLEGQEFTNKFMEPLDVDTIQKILYSGWDIDRVFLLTLHAFCQFQNIPSKEERCKNDQFEKFLSTIHLMRKLQNEGKLRVGIKEVKSNGTTKKILQFAIPANDEISEEIAKILNCEELEDGNYVINIVEGFDNEGKVGVLPRSLLSCMSYLSKNVIVPINDEKNNKVKMSDLLNKKKLGSLLIILSSKTRPVDCYLSIKYRDHWFYIKDNDLNSKKTFMLLLELFNIQSGKRENRGPILTLPIGVG